MLTLTYLAVCEPSAHDAYSIYFPDLPGCASFAKDLLSIQNIATDALNLHIYGLRRDGLPIPEPSTKLNPSITAGNIVMPITIYPDIYPEIIRRQASNARAKVNCTIPAWLKRQANSQRVNYSHLLERALLDYLGISEDYSAKTERKPAPWHLSSDKATQDNNTSPETETKST